MAVVPSPGATTADIPLLPPWTRRRATLVLIGVIAVGLSLWGLRRVELSFFALLEGWPQTQNLLERMWPPYIPSEDFAAVWRATLDTFFMAYAGTAIGVFLAVPLALASARNVMPWAPVRAAARAIIVFTRAVPALVFALIFVRVYGIGVLPGVLAIGIHSVGMLGKLLGDAAENIDPGPRDGIVSTGAGPMQDVVTGVWRQMVPSAIAVTLYRLEIDFRGATLLGFVGAGGIGLILKGYQGSLRYQELLGVTLLIVVLVICMEALSALTRRALLGDGRPSEGGLLSLFRGRAADAHHLASMPVATGSSINAPWDPPRRRLAIAGVGSVVLLVLSFIVPDMSVREFFSSVGEMPSVFWKLVPKDMSWFTDGVRADLVETIAIGFASTFLALIVAVPFAFMAANNVAPGRWVYRSARLFLLLVRAIPELVVAVIFVAAIGLGPATGTLALAIGMFGFITKLFADSIEEIRQGPRDGVFATGATRTQEVGTGVVPQVLPALLGNALYVLDVSLRSSTVLGIVGAGGIGFLLSNAARTVKFEVVGGIVLSIFVIVYAIELLASWVRRQVL
jgi:phosphonate transport system permease protein